MRLRMLQWCDNEALDASNIDFFYYDWTESLILVPIKITKINKPPSLPTSYHIHLQITSSHSKQAPKLSSSFMLPHQFMSSHYLFFLLTFSCILKCKLIFCGYCQVTAIIFGQYKFAGSFVLETSRDQFKMTLYSSSSLSSQSANKRK